MSCCSHQSISPSAAPTLILTGMVSHLAPQGFQPVTCLSVLTLSWLFIHSVAARPSRLPLGPQLRFPVWLSGLCSAPWTFPPPRWPHPASPLQSVHCSGVLLFQASPPSCSLLLYIYLFCLLQLERRLDRGRKVPCCCVTSAGSNAWPRTWWALTKYWLGE